MRRMGIDWGGTKIEAAILDDDGSFLFRERIRTPRSYDDALDAVTALVERLETRFGRCTIGFGTPGSVSPKSGLMRGCNSTFLNERPLKKDMEIRLGRSLRFANDANCLAISEAKDGAAAGFSVVVGVILGTGAGSGIVINGRLVEGAHGIAGEFGHVPLPYVSPGDAPATCWCGQQNCNELFISGTGFSRVYEAHFGDKISSEEIITRRDMGDGNARIAYQRYVDQLARALSLYVNMLDPDAIVLGGGMGQIAGLEDDLLKVITPYIFSDYFNGRFLKPKFGAASGVRGAAWLWES